jgi:hypothetical protein
VNAYFRPPAAKPKEVKVVTELCAPALEHAPASSQDYAFGAAGYVEEGKASAPAGYVLETITLPGDKSGRRAAWELLHKNLGRATFILAIAGVGLGLDVALADYAR